MQEFKIVMHDDHDAQYTLTVLAQDEDAALETSLVREYVNNRGFHVITVSTRKEIFSA